MIILNVKICWESSSPEEERRHIFIFTCTIFYCIMVGRHPIRLTADEALCWIYSVLHLLTLLFQQHRYSTTVKKCIFLGSKYYLVFHRLCSSNLEPLQFGTFTGENEFWLMIILSNTVTYIYFISPHHLLIRQSSLKVLSSLLIQLCAS